LKSNKQLVYEFREIMGRDLKESGIDPNRIRPWRVEMWEKFKELEERLCPVEADMKKKARGESL
jgi:hypothetical protein